MPSLDQTPQCSNSKCGSTSAIFQRCARCQNTMYCSRDCQAAAWPTHKATCKRRNYLVKFHLCPDDITDPPVIRTLSCPANATFYNLHRALQTAFEWAGTHSFDFTVGDSDFEPPNEEDMTAFISRMMSSQNGQPANSAREFVLRITDPAPYEPMMGMGIDRMHEGRRKHPRTPEKKANVVRLHQVLDDANYKDLPICYTYDFGDHWMHYFTVEGRADAADRFECISGEGHHVAEDCGSAPGWREYKEAYHTTNPNKEQKKKRHWFENQASNPDYKGLANGRDRFWDKERINEDLADIR